MHKIKLIRITTVSGSLRSLLRGQLRYMNQYFEVIGIASSGEALFEVQTTEGVRTIEVNMTRSISPFHDLISLWKLVKIFNKEKPDIVHTHTPKAGTLGMIASWLCRIPLRLHTVAGLPLVEKTGIKRKLLDVVEIITYQCATCVYPNSIGLADIIIKNRYTKSQKIKVIGNGSSNGIDTDYFSIESVPFKVVNEIKLEYNIVGKDFVYIYIGRLVKDKGINELVESFVQVFEKYENIKLLLVGSTEQELDPLSEETLNTISHHPNIKMVGYQRDVRPFLAASSVLVFPSYREGFPNVPMQACAMGLPCIVSDINGCNEIITHKHNGLIVSPKNVPKLMEAMESILANAKLYHLLKLNSRKSILSRFDQKVHWEKIKMEYDKQLASKSK